ncbi:KOW motif domain-containing protein [Candidatus Karelsulcia muelleri]
MNIKNKDYILIHRGHYKGNQGKVINIRTNQNRALVEIGTQAGKRLIEIDISNLLLIYRPIQAKSLNANKFKLLQQLVIKMRQMNNKLNNLFSIEELNNFFKLRYLETMTYSENDLLP